MTGRILASLAFFGGGVLLWFILGGLHGLAMSQAGMSAGPVAGPPSTDAMIPWFVCSYFAISGIGVPFAKNRGALAVIAALTYLMLLISFFLLCSEASGYESSKFFEGVLVVGLLALFAFSPWHIIWCCLLLMRRHDDAV